MYTLAVPWALLLLLLPFIIWYLLPKLASQIATALTIPFFNAVSGLVAAQKRVIMSQNQVMLLFLVWALVVIAIAGPKWVGSPISMTREGYNIMLALDISGSMDANDMLLNGRSATRLQLVKRAASQFVDERSGDRMGLILFGERAYLQTPLTYDRQAILSRIDDATVGLAGKSTSIGDALGLAIKKLQHAPQAGRVIILLTDGVNNSGVLQPTKAAEIARIDDIKIYTIGLGTDLTAQYGGFYGLMAQAELDEKTLKNVANTTGGRYFRATDSKSLQSIYQTINSLEKVASKQDVIRPQHDYYPWFLAVALIIFMGWLSQKNGSILHYFRRRAHV